MVATPKFTREQRAGRFMYPVAGTSIPDRQPIRNNDDANAANTSVRSTAACSRCARWPGVRTGSDDLATLGPVTWRPTSVAAIPFSAHPLRDRDGLS